jgi:hypothetical protein
MKNYLFIFLLLVSFMFQSCSEDDLATTSHTDNKTRVSFSLDETTSAKIPDGSSLLVSVNSATGEEVYADHALTLTKANGVLVSESIELAPNEFELAEFMIFNGDEVIYASPKTGSEMAAKVSQPLGNKFMTGAISQLTLPVEVADARRSQPDKFGYRSFKKKPKNTFKIIAYFYDNGVKTPLSSYLQIRNEDTAYYYYMDAKVNTFTFSGNPKETYTLTSYRAGFYREEMPFTLGKSKEKNNDVIEIIMEFTDPEDIITLMPTDETNVEFTLGMVGVGALTADFGNGNSQYGPFPANPEIIYPPDTSYMVFNSEPTYEPVKISGDLDQVVSFYGTAMHLVDLKRLPNLSEFKYALASTDILDLTQNLKLRFLRLSYCYIPEIRLNSTELRKIYLEGTSIDHIISEVYENTKAHNVRGGAVIIVDEEISETTQQQLDDLQNNYGWTIKLHYNH